MTNTLKECLKSSTNNSLLNGLKSLSSEELLEFEKKKDALVKSEIKKNMSQNLTNLSPNDQRTFTWDKILIDTQELSDCVKKLQTWHPEKHKFGIFLYGMPGNGKTHMIKAMMLDHCSQMFRFKFFSENQIIAKSYNFRDWDAFRANELMKPQGLVIDELGGYKDIPEHVELRKEQDQDTIGSLIEQRHNEGKVTLFTSNLNQLTLKMRYSLKLLSRFLRVSRFVLNRAPSWEDKLQKEFASSMDDPIL